MEAANKSLPQEEVVSWMRAKAQQTNALIAGSAAIQSERGPVNRFFWLSPKVMCISTTSAICSAWRTSISITMQVTRALLLNGAAGAFCRWSVMTCVFRYGRVIATITTGVVCCQLACAAFAALAASLAARAIEKPCLCSRM